MSVLNIIIVPIIIWVFIRSVSYGRWTWKRKNKLGGAAVILVAFASVILTVYAFLIK